MRKLNYFIKKDARIKKVYTYAKGKYLKTNKPQHNWEHILRDLYRALVIAETINGVDYSILIPAVILHDIGVTETDKYKTHEEVGAKIIKRYLPQIGYTEKEVGWIVHCVESHDGKRKPETIEAKILFDADKLEKSGIGGIFSFYRAQQELNIPIYEWIEKGIKRTHKFIKEGFYTKKAKEISGNGFIEIKEHYKKAKEALKKRKDWTITEKDLWSSV